ncbi:MAG: ErfK/YbiS/YcfS/YnhG family protein, partial [uncultured bacterium]
AFAQNFFAFSTGFTGGGFLAAIDLANGTTSVLTSPSRKIYTGRTDFYKYIEVDISEQRLRAYREGEEVFTTLVSTGIYRYPTPIGTFSVRDHVKSQRMTWEYGPDHPDNYDLANVPNVMHFYQGYALHGAYWHNNFGRRMSHGCINIPLGAAEWLYNWADNGDAVIVHE